MLLNGAGCFFLFKICGEEKDDELERDERTTYEVRAQVDFIYIR
jgi:hypothetical protein